MSKEKILSQFREIFKRYKELGELLDGIELTELEANFTRPEMKELEKQLNDQKNLRYLSSDIRKLHDQMREKEYPDLLGVHHFPEIKNISFLTDEQKLKLDNHLYRFRVGNYLAQLWRAVPQSKEKETLQFLVDAQIVETVSIVKCRSCRDYHMTEPLTAAEKDKLLQILQTEHSPERLDALEKFFPEYICMECDSEINLWTMKEADVVFDTNYRLIKEPDHSLYQK